MGQSMRHLNQEVLPVFRAAGDNQHDHTRRVGPSAFFDHQPGHAFELGKLQIGHVCAGLLNSVVCTDLRSILLNE